MLTLGRVVMLGDGMSHTQRPLEEPTYLLCRSLTPLSCLLRGTGTEEDLDQHSFLAVYDGHGGVFSAQYCGQHMINFLKGTPGYEEYKR